MIDCWIGVKTAWIFGVIHGNRAIPDHDAFAGEGDNALDNIFLSSNRRVKVRVFKNDDLSAFWYILRVFELRHCHREAIDDESISGIHG